MPILWLASYPKSGNTWLRAFLANYLKNEDTPEDINALPAFALGDMRIEPYLRISGKPAAALTRADINRLRPQVHRAIAASRPGLVLVKTHTALATIAGVPTITPEATHSALYVIRNPLDVAVSFSHHYAVTMEQAVRAVCFKGLEIPPKEGHVVQIISDWTTHVRGWTRASGLRLKTVRYEDLLADPAAAFGAVAAFLGWAEDPARLARAIRHSSFKILSGQERERGFVERSRGAAKFFRRGGAGGWREALSPTQVETVVDRHGPLMRELGYIGEDGKLLV